MIDRLQECRDLLHDVRLGIGPEEQPVEWMAALRWAVGELETINMETPPPQDQELQEDTAAKTVNTRRSRHYRIT